MPLVLGVDSSTAATRVELRDAEDGHLYAAGSATHAVTPGPGGDLDPAEWWHSLVEARYTAGGALGVSAVAVAAPSDGLVVLDAGGNALRPAKVGADLDARVDAEVLVDELGGPDAWSAACGSVPDPSYPIAKLAWLRRVEPDVFARVAKVLTPHDWLTFRLARRFVTDRGDASTTGYWSPRESRWRDDLLSIVDDRKDWIGCVPDVLAPTEPAGYREGVVIAPGTGSHQAIALGLGLNPHDVVMSLDGEGECFAIRERPTEDPTGAVGGYADATGRFMPLARSFDGMRVVEALSSQLGIDLDRLDHLALGAPAGAGGVRLAPFLDAEERVGRRTPRGRLTGLHVDIEQEHVARALVEGVACVLLRALDDLRTADVPVGGRLVVVGYAARSHAFQRVIADLAGRPVFVPATADLAETGALGACVQASAVLHEVDPTLVADAWGLGPARMIEPDFEVDALEIRADYATDRVA